MLLPRSACLFISGETTIGRTDDQDITIADPSVSGSHAVIDVLELPGGGGKRLTLKVLLHTGKGIVDAGFLYAAVIGLC